LAAAQAAQNAAVNNRLATQAERDRIRQLAGGDTQKEARLTAAACSMIRCADGVPMDDPNYAYLKTLQEAGAVFKDEQALLAQQSGSTGGRTYGPLFQYSWVDQYLLDPAAQNRLTTRSTGALQGGLGIAGAVGSAGLCTTGAGCVAGAITGTVSADYAAAGLRQAWSGQAATPYGEQVLRSLGLSPQAAAAGYGIFGIAPVAAPAVAQTVAKAAPQLDALLLNAQAKIGQNLDDVAASLARESTQTAGATDRVVLGRWQGDYAGYVGEAKLNGGTWYQTDAGVFERMTAGLTQIERDALSWKVNEMFLTQQLQKGVAKLEVTGPSIAEVKMNYPNSYLALEIKFLEANAAKYGYQQVGNSWVKVTR
jgi:hypothetical protein